ncbi:MAG: hypothetical protein ACSLE6_02900 [Mycobacterium sp.]
MMTFQFEDECDYFTIDPVACGVALGPGGMAAYRAKLDERAAALGPRPSDDQPFSAPHCHEWSILDWNARRLAVFDRDVEAIIRTHARDRRVAAWFHATAEALMEIGQVDLAIDWAQQAGDFDDGHQSRRASDYWCELLAEHRLPNCCKRGSRCSAAGRRRARQARCTGTQVGVREDRPDRRPRRGTYRRRPRLQAEFDKAGLP